MTKIQLDLERIKRTLKLAIADKIADPTPVRLGHPAPTTVADAINVPVSLAGRPGFVFFHGIGDTTGDLQGISMALNGGAIRREDMVWGAPILIRRRRQGDYEIVGLDKDANAEYTHRMVIHPQTSTVLGQFDNGLLQPTNPPSMKAGIGYGTYRYLGRVCKVVSQMTKDFTADVPGASLARAVAVEVNPVDNTLFYTNGSTYSATLTDQEAFDAGNFPQPTNALMCGWVKLTNGMTEIKHQRNLIPAHEVMTVDRLPLSLNHYIIIQSNVQIVAHRCKVTGTGKITLTGTGVLHFT
jgi:hypothetical protein